MYIVNLHLCPFETLHVFCYYYSKTLQMSQKDFNGRFVENTGTSSPIINACVFWCYLILLCCDVLGSLLRCHLANPTLTCVKCCKYKSHTVPHQLRHIAVLLFNCNKYCPQNVLTCVTQFDHLGSLQTHLFHTTSSEPELHV